MSLDVVGIGAINWDMIFEISLKDFDLLNKELESKGIAPLARGGESLGKSEELETTLEIIKKYAKPIGEDLGGSAANTIRSLSRMGFSTGYFGLLGHDDNFLLRNLEREGIDTSKILRDGIRSGVCVSVSDGIDRYLRVYPNSNDLLGLKHLSGLEDYFETCKIIHMTSFVCSLGYEPLEVQTKIAERFNKRVKISFSPGELYANLGLEKLKPILKNTDILLLKRREMMKLIDKHYTDATLKLSELGPKYVVCTLSREGAFLVYDGKTYRAEKSTPPEQIKQRHLTGAGDYFAGGFLAGILMGKSPSECADLGNEIAGYWLKGLELPKLKT